MLDDGLLVVRDDHRARERRALGCDSAVERLRADGIGSSELRDVDLLARPLLEHAGADDVTELDDRLIDRDACGGVGRNDERPLLARLGSDRQRRVAESLRRDRRGVHDLHRRCDLTGESLHGTAVGFGALPDRRVGTARCRSRHRGCLIRRDRRCRSDDRLRIALVRPTTPVPVPVPDPGAGGAGERRALGPAPGPPVDLAAPAPVPAPAPGLLVCRRFPLDNGSTGKVVPRPVPARAAHDPRARVVERRLIRVPRPDPLPHGRSRRRPRRGVSAPAPRCRR